MRRAALVVVTLALALAAGARAQDTLQLARERMELRAFGDAFRFIKQEIASNPRSWRGYAMLGEYYQRGLSQPDQALQAWLKAWSLGIGRVRTGSEPEEFRLLGETLTKNILERSASSGENGQKVLEQALVEHGFVSLPLIRQMMPRYIAAARWTAVKKVLAIVAKQPEADYYRESEGELAWLAYYEGKMLAGTGELAGAYSKLEAANKRGIQEASAELSRLGTQLEAAVMPTLAEAALQYGRRNYIGAKDLYKQAMTKLPPELAAYEKASQAVANCESGIAIEAALQAVESSRQKGDFATAIKLTQAALAKWPQDPRLQEQMTKMQDVHAKLTAQAEATAEARDKAEREAKDARMKLVAEGMALKARGNFLEATEKLREAQKLKKTEDIDKQLEELTHGNQVQETYESGANSFKKRDWATALKSFEKMSELDSSYRERDVKKMMALCYFELHQIDKGRLLAEKLLGHTEDPQLLHKMAELSEGNRESRLEMQKAVQYLERLGRIEGEASVADKIAELNWEINKPKYIALATFVILWIIAFVIVKKKGDWTKKVNLVDLQRFMDKKRWQDAADLYPSLIKSSTALSEQEELNARQMFARAYYELGMYQKSISECQAVLRMLPENKQLKMLMAKCLYATKNISPETLQYYIELLETDQQNKDLVQFIGDFAVKKRLVTPMTIPILRQLAALKPEDDGLRGLLIKSNLKDNDRSPGAIALYEAEKKKNPKNIDVRVILAEDYLRKGEVTRAIEACEEIINIELNHARTHEVLAKAYAKLGKIPDLIALYQSILETDPHNGAIVGFLGKLTSGAYDKPSSLDRSVGSLDRSGALFDRSSGSGSLERAAMAEVPPAPASNAGSPVAAPVAERSGITERPPAVAAERSSVTERSGITERPVAADRSGVAPRIVPRTASGSVRGSSPLSPEQQKAMFEKSGSMDASGASASGTQTRGGPTCPKCGEPVANGTYFCSCGQPL